MIKFEKKDMNIETFKKVASILGDDSWSELKIMNNAINHPHFKGLSSTGGKINPFYLDPEYYITVSEFLQLQKSAGELQYAGVIDRSPKKKTESDGGKNNFYTFPKYVNNIDSLARHLDLNGAQNNVLKALTVNLGNRHNGTNPSREAKKCLHYAVENMLWNGFSQQDIIDQITKQLGENDDII